MTKSLKAPEKTSHRPLFLRKKLCFTPKKARKTLKTPPAVTYRGNLFEKKFTGKETDPETGLYYYGARYLDPKTSRWISGDPALGDYLPSAPLGEDEKKRNSNLPGQGGVFNYVNLHVYHYAGNNPVKYTDPDGRNDEPKVSGLEDALRIMNRGVDLNLFKPLTVVSINANRAVNPEGMFIVAAHGFPLLIIDDRSREPQDTGPITLATEIRNHAKYNPSDIVVLASCNTGVPDETGVPFAQRLADALGPGAIVLAPDNYAAFSVTGEFYVGPESRTRPGHISHNDPRVIKSNDYSALVRFIGSERGK